jgi:GlpG protein
MRQIATLPEQPARTFIDYLATLKIAARPLDEPGGIGVWICDEDRIEQARQELSRYLSDPADPRYGRAAAAARALRRRELAEEEDYQRAQKDAEEKLEQAKAEDAAPPPGPRPLTFVLMGACVLVAIATNLGSETNALTRSLWISTQPPAGDVGLIEVRSGEVWRLVTPILLHFKTENDPIGPMHLLFNLFLFLPLAGQVESLRGTGRLAVLVLLLAVASNLTQYYLGGSTIQGVRPVIAGSYNFGGLSGVVYGLFGFIWMKSRLEPESGLGVSIGTTIILVGWLLLGPLVEPRIANGAHFGGLIAGALIAAAPSLWRRPPAEEKGEEEE